MIKEKPLSGLYGSSELYRACKDLQDELDNFIMEDRSHGNLSLGGVASMARAKAFALVQKAKIVESITKAITNGRK